MSRRSVLRSSVGDAGKWIPAPVRSPYSAESFKKVVGTPPCTHGWDGSTSGPVQAQAQEATQWAWVSDPEDGGPPVHTQLVRNLCAAMPAGSDVVMVGDSLSLQMEVSWKVRLHHERLSRAEGATQGQDDAQSSTCASNGARLRHHWAPNLATRGIIFTSSSTDPTAVRCANALRRNYKEYGMPKIVPVGALPALAKHADVLVWSSTYSWLNKFVGPLTACYARNGSSSAYDVDRERWAQRLARRDMLRFWRENVAAQADALRALGNRTQVFFRATGPGAERWVRPTGTPTTTEPTSPPLTRVIKPLSDCGEVALATDPAPPTEFHHDLFAAINDISVAAFRAAGHRVIDHECMLGVRVDARPGTYPSTPRHSDLLHYCFPGVPDWSLDAVLRAAYPTTFEQQAALERAASLKR